MPAFHRVDGLRLRVNDDGTMAVEVIVVRRNGQHHVVASVSVGALSTAERHALKAELDERSLLS